MLIRLHIQNLAIAENVCVSLTNGLNIITGETGAGKSLLVDGLALLRGNKADVGLIRDGTESASVTGTFKLLSSSKVWAQLETHGCLRDEDAPDEVTLRRVLNRNGKHRSYLNDTQISARVMQEVAAELIDISSQFENQKLLNPDTHTFYLDEFVETTEVRESFQATWQSAWTLVGEIERLEKELALQRREQDLCQFELDQIDQADLRDDEWSRVQRIVALGQKTAQAARHTSELRQMIADAETSCMSQLSMCRRSIERLLKLSASQHIPLGLEKIDEISAHFEELLQQVEATEDAFSIDEHELQECLARSEIYNTILQKFGPGLENVRAHRERCMQTLSLNDALRDQILQKKDTLAKAIRLSLGFSRDLSARRRSGLSALSASIQKALAELGMPQARFLCELQRGATQSVPRQISADTVENISADELDAFLQLSRNGAERAQFLMSANAGIAPQPIERVASGGELSRTMLAIKSILFEDGAVSVFVFDEIDTGISGSIASKVGRKMAEFCAQRQALCITHLAQVACFANCHFIATKNLKKGKTVAEIKVASTEERIHALAGMVAGERLTRESLAQAKALLNEAQGVLNS
jgi:DNA repair protein RecN (Recombination protein N)